MGKYVYGNRKFCQLPKKLATNKMGTVAESSLIYSLLTLLEGVLATKQVNTNKPLELLSQIIVSKDA